MVHAVKRYCFCQRCCLRRTQCMVAQMDKALEERDPKMRRGPRQTFSFKCFHIRIKLRSRRKNSRTARSTGLSGEMQRFSSSF
ncbi:Oidioi.mRNA.OKI2018_I69.chr1.g249.t1.cds [Oikopleura dioica]|uniref:Oidioi.mRNA.OKI2018_I69.chr1.g249.t1.cds n=1 Tax=Oikopleura dioica TaxID=34765 RepID=A0ABN7SNH0_OIKDI|nr:Oidioi.mRNA.OKI2018_I69.chr1.g249.t1.cds [Oikopleura dioica]